MHADWYNQQFPGQKSKQDYYQKLKNQNSPNISSWLQQLFFDGLNPLLKKKGQSWLTVGDAYGLDARYISSQYNLATASDLSEDMLKVAKQNGFIEHYTAQNAESLTFGDAYFDYILCKESYHHFPRPYAALYEMLRVCKKGFVLMEPQDPVSKMPLLLALLNLSTTFAKKASNSLWKNRFSYEPVGNFVYKISERELEKFAAALGLPLVAHRHINPNFYFKGCEQLGLTSRKFCSIRLKKQILDLLVYLRLLPGQVLCSVVFKDSPGPDLIEDLISQGYRIVEIPKNPYTRQ